MLMQLMIPVGLDSQDELNIYSANEHLKLINYLETPIGNNQDEYNNVLQNYIYL